MAQLSHANLAPLHVAFVSRGELWLVMPLVVGSCAEVLRLTNPKGFDEHKALALLREARPPPKKGAVAADVHGG